MLSAPRTVHFQADLVKTALVNATEMCELLERPTLMSGETLENAVRLVV
jgi:hypothetical protein